MLCKNVCVDFTVNYSYATTYSQNAVPKVNRWFFTAKILTSGKWLLFEYKGFE